MKQYSSPEQTAKLIELGFEKPKSIEKVTYIEQYGCGYETAYSIGELIEMLPESASQRLRYVATKRAWVVDADVLGKDGRCYRGCYHRELIDALYAMILQLKEEEVI